MSASESSYFRDSAIQPPPELSLVVPIHNEASIVVECLSSMLDDLTALPLSFEVIACENGSTDGTVELMEKFQAGHPHVRIEHLPRADYGMALKRGIATSRANTIAIVNIDFWCIDFIRASLPRLDENEMVIGSKAMPDSVDRRPLLRRLITRGFNGFLRVVFGFGGTDTHGVKVFRRQPLASIAAECVTNQFIFDTELVLRAERAGVRIVEIPVDVSELRAPRYPSLVKRSPKVLWNLIKLRLTLPASRA